MEERRPIDIDEPITVDHNVECTRRSKNSDASFYVLYEAIINQLRQDGFMEISEELSKKLGIEVNDVPLGESLSTYYPIKGGNRGNSSHWEPLKFRSGVGQDTKKTLNFEIGPSIKCEEEIIDPTIPRELILQLAPPIARVSLNHRKACLCVAASQHGRLMASGGADGTVKTVEVPPRGQEIGDAEGDSDSARVYTYHKAAVVSVDIHPRRGIVFSGSIDGIIKIVDIRNRGGTGNKIAATLHDAYSIRSISVHPCGDFLYVAAKHNKLRLYDLQTLQCYSCTESSQGDSTIVSLQISKDGAYVATSFDDGNIKLWDVTSGRSVNILEQPMGGYTVTSLSWSKAPWYLMGAGLGGTTTIWDLRKGQAVITFGSGSLSYSHNTAIFLDDEEYVAQASIGGTKCNDRDISIYSAYTGQWILTFAGIQSQPVTHMVPTPSQLGILSASLDGRARWLDLSHAQLGENLRDIGV